jgi:hypothetical protein
MPHIIKPTDTPPVSKKRPVIDTEPAVIVHRGQLKTDAQLKKDVLAETERRKKLTEATTDEEFKQLYEMVGQLIVQRDFWELHSDSALQFVYGYVVQEMKKRGVALPRVEDTPPESKKEK